MLNLRYLLTPTLVLSSAFAQQISAKNLQPKCPTSQAHFTAGVARSWTVGSGKCDEAIILFNDSTLVSIGIQGSMCEGLATQSVALNTTTPLGWAEITLICAEGSICRKVLVQPQPPSLASAVMSNEVIQTCLPNGIILSSILTASRSSSALLSTGPITSKSEGPQASTGLTSSIQATVGIAASTSQSAPQADSTAAGSVAPSSVTVVSTGTGDIAGTGTTSQVASSIVSTCTCPCSC